MRALLLFIFLMGFKQISAQQRFTASTDSKAISESSNVTVEFTLENARGSNFRPPEFENFTVLKGPRKSQQSSNVNGRLRSSLSYSYTLRPKKQGNLTIGYASIKVNGKWLKTKPLSVKVSKSTGREFFVTMELSDSIAHMGQQIIVDYKLHYKAGLNIRSVDLRREDEFEGFFVIPIKDYKSKPEKQIIDGKEYIVQTVRKLGLFPQTKGRFDVQAANFSIYFPQKKRKGFYFDSFKEEVALTEPGVIDVRDLPSQKPFFSGAIGQYQVNSTTNKSTITTDQSFTLNLTINGNGDPKLITPPVLNLTDSLEVYEPNLLQERKFIDDGMQKHIATYEYLIVPKKIGEYKITPQLVFYNPDSADYNVAYGSLVVLNVIPGSGTGNSTTDIILSERADKMVPLNDKMSLHKPRAPFFNSYFHWIAFSTLLLGFPLLIFFKYSKVKKSNIDPELLKSQRAQKIAEKKLATAKGFMDQNEQKSFYNEISKSLLGYASDRLKIPVSQLSSSNITEQLKNLNITEQLIENVKEILQACEMALFAGTNQVDKMNSIFQKSNDTISQIEIQLAQKES